MNQEKSSQEKPNHSDPRNSEHGEDTFPTKNPKNIRFDNTERDEGTTGVSRDRHQDPALADEDQPQWQPPESIPEPRPADPILKSH